MSLPAIQLERYALQRERWPQTGRHILAHYDDESIVVYQAYRTAIANWAIENQKLGGPDFSFNRMSWIKPNFLWMMYRSGWGTKEGQERVIGLRLRREFFDRVVRSAVPSSHYPALHPSRDEWQAALKRSNVRLQWDPDHAPGGAPTERRAIQLGLRGEALLELAGAGLLEVIDMTAIVERGRAQVINRQLALLETPAESVYRAAAE